MECIVRVDATGVGRGRNLGFSKTERERERAIKKKMKIRSEREAVRIPFKDTSYIGVCRTIIKPAS